MSDDSQLPQISFRVSPSIHEALKAKTKSEGQTVTGLMKSLIEQYLEGKASDDLNPTTPPATTAPPMHPMSQSESSLNERRLDSLERLTMSMLDTTALTNRIASLEFRFVDFSNLLEKRLPVVAGYDPTLHTSTSQRGMGSQIPESVTPLLARLAKVEAQLANGMEGQQLQDQSARQDLAEPKANIEPLIATQLAEYNTRLQEMQQSMSVRYDANLESLTEMKANLVGQLEQHSVQIPALAEAIANLQQQLQAAKPPAALPTTPERLAPSQKAVSGNQRSKANAPRLPTKPVVSKPEAASTVSSKTANQPDNMKQAENQKVEQSMSSGMTIDGDSVVINGKRQTMLYLNEAFEVAQKRGYKGNKSQFGKLSDRQNWAQTYRDLGLGAVPELRGKSGKRKAWFYTL